MSARYRVIVPLQESRLAMPCFGLTRDHRSRLSQAFAADTLEAIRGCRSVRDIVLVSADPVAARIASDAEATFIQTMPGTGLNAAINYAHHQTRQPSDQMVAAIVSDLPALTSIELEEVLASAGRCHDSIYVTDLGPGVATFQAERATTFEACLAPDPTRRQRPRGAHVKGLLPGLRCDVDTHAGLRIAAYIGVGSATRREVDDLGLFVDKGREAA